MSMKSSSSAKATISSYFSSSCSRVEPGGEPAEHDVLAPGHLAVEADAEREQRAHAPVDLDAARVGRQDARHRAHQRGLAGAVGADHAEHLALGHLEGDVLERLDLAHDPLAAAEPQHRALERGRGLERRPVGHRHVLDPDPRLRQSRTANSRSREMKNSAPARKIPNAHAAASSERLAARAPGAGLSTSLHAVSSPPSGLTSRIQLVARRAPRWRSRGPARRTATRAASRAGSS